MVIRKLQITVQHRKAMKPFIQGYAIGYNKGYDEAKKKIESEKVGASQGIPSSTYPLPQPSKFSGS
jgi:hypothetical protein